MHPSHREKLRGLKPETSGSRDSRAISDNLYEFWKERALTAEERLRVVIQDLVRDRDELSSRIRNANVGGATLRGNKFCPIVSVRLKLLNQILVKLDIRQGL